MLLKKSLYHALQISSRLRDRSLFIAWEVGGGGDFRGIKGGISRN